MKDIEIPLHHEKDWRYKFFEKLPGLLTWSVLALPFVLSVISPRLTVFFIIFYLLMWFMRAVAMNIRVLQGWRTMQQHMKLNWLQLLKELEEEGVSDADAKRPEWHYENLLRLQVKPALVKPSEIIHVIIIATYNETRAVLEPTIQAILESNYNMSKVTLVIAYEGRDGAQAEKPALELTHDYKDKFRHIVAIKHPLTPNEVRGKGGNLNYAGQFIQKYFEKEGGDLLRVIVTSLDSDHRVHPNYLAGVTYTYCVAPDPVRNSFQPIPMFTNNIWDAPAPMRVIATGNSFWMVVLALRPHILRNFASHSQSLQGLRQTNFWSARTIVEDGHQFWRSYFAFDGKHDVYPIFLPIYQDAVLAETYLKTLRAQFLQIRRWAWGASDIAYVSYTGFFKKNKVPKLDLTLKLLRLVEGHVSWATAPLILAFSSFIPLLLNPQDFSANQLPLIASRIQQIAMGGIIITMFLSFKALPPKPKRYKAHRTLFMILQWVYLPVTSIVYSSFAALTSQTRLLFGLYLDRFDVTTKAVKTETKDVIV